MRTRIDVIFMGIDVTSMGIDVTGMGIDVTDKGIDITGNWCEKEFMRMLRFDESEYAKCKNSRDKLPGLNFSPAAVAIAFMNADCAAAFGACPPNFFIS